VELPDIGKTWHHLRWIYLILAKHGITLGALPDIGKTWNHLRWNYLILAKHGITSGGTT
jgi:hypothetical protein